MRYPSPIACPPLLQSLASRPLLSFFYASSLYGHLLISLLTLVTSPGSPGISSSITGEDTVVLSWGHCSSGGRDGSPAAIILLDNFFFSLNPRLLSLPLFSLALDESTPVVLGEIQCRGETWKVSSSTVLPSSTELDPSNQEGRKPVRSSAF